MSSVDNRIVKLQFDNEQFERGVSKSMSTLDKLEEKLQFKNSAKGLSNLQNSINSISFNRFTDALEGINSKLSATGVMAATVVSRITSSLIDGAMQIERATIGQIKSGGWNRAMNIENAKFSIEGLKEDWNELYKAMDYAVTGTAYGIDQAATAAASLVASGVDYLEVVEKSGDTNVTAMHKALRAISGVAAQTNSDFQSISRIFTTVAGQGRLMGDQLNQLAARGMNAAAKLGEALGMTEADVRAAVSAGAIDFETFAFAMDDAFGEHATDANKTFTGSLSNMKAALSRFGAVFATPVIQKTNTFFIALTDRIKEMKNAISDVTKNGEVLEEHLESHFAQMWEELIELADTLTHKIDLTWFWNIADAADNATVKIRDLLSTLNDIFNKEAESLEDVAEKTYDLSSITEEELKLAQEVIQGNYGTGAKRVKALAEAAGGLGLDPVKIQEYVNAVANYGYSFDKAGIKVKEFTDEEEEMTLYGLLMEHISKDMTIAIHNFSNATDNAHTISSAMWDDLMYNVGQREDFVLSVDSMASALRDISFEAASTSTNLIKNADWMYEWTEALSNLLSIFGLIGRELSLLASAVYSIIAETIKWWNDSGELYDTMSNIKRIARNLTNIIGNMMRNIRVFVRSVLRALLNVLSPSKLTGVLADFTDGLYGLSAKFTLTAEDGEKITTIFEGLFSVIQSVVIAVGEFISKITMALTGIKRTDDEMEETPDLMDGLATGFAFTTTAISKFIDILANIPTLLTMLSDALSENEGVKRLKTAITTLWETMNDAVDDGLEPFKEAVGDIEGTDPSEVTIKQIADAIGWLADKIAFVIEKIPEFKNKFEEFWDTFKEKATTAWEWIDSKIDFDSIKTKVENAFDSTDGKDILDKIKDFFGKITDKIKEYLESIDWESVKTDSITLGILGVLWSLVKLGDESAQLVSSIKSIPDAISGIFKGFKTLLSSAASMTKNFGIAAVIAAIAAAVLAIASAIALLAEIPEDKFERASQTISTIVSVISIIALAVAGTAKAVAKIKLSQTVEYIKLDILKAFAQTVASAILIVAIAAAVKMIIDAVKNIYDMFTNQKFDLKKFLIALGIVAGIFVALLVATKFITKQIKKAIKSIQQTGVGIGKTAAMTRSLGLMLIGYGVIIAGLGAAVWFIADAITKLSTTDISIGAILGVFGIMAAIILAITWLVDNLTNSLRGFKATDILAIAGLLFVFTLGLAAIIGVVLGLSLIATGASFLGKEKIIEIMFAEVIALVLVLGYAVSSIIQRANALNAAGAKKIFGVFLVIGALAGAIIAIGYSVKLICEGLSTFSTDSTDPLEQPLASMIFIIVLLGGAIMNIIKAVAKNAVSTSELLSAAVLIGAFGAMIYLVALAFKTIGEAMNNMNETQISTAIILMIGLMGIVTLGMIAMIAVVSLLGSSAPQTMVALGAAVALMASTLLIMAASFWLLSQVKWNDQITKAMNGMLIAMGVMLLILMVGGLFSKGNSEFGQNVILLATALVIVSASMIVFAAACLILQMVDPLLIAGVAGAMLLFMGTIGLLAYFLDKMNDPDKILQGIAIAILSIGGSVLLAGAGMLLIAEALKKLIVVLPVFTMVLSGVFKVLADNKLMVLIFIGALVVAMYAVIKVLQTIGPLIVPVLQTVATFIENMVNLLGKGASKIGTMVGNAITSLHQNATPKVKLLVVGIIGSLLSALTESGPKVLQTIGKLLIMLMDWLSDAIGPLVDKLIVLLINLIEGLRKAIQSHSNAIGAAIGNLVYALIDLALSVINQLLRMVMGGWNNAWYDATIGKHIAGMQENLRDMADTNMDAAKAMDELASGGAGEYREWCENVEDVTAEMHSLKKTAGSFDMSNLKLPFGSEDVDTMTKFAKLDAKEFDISNMPNNAVEDMISKGIGDFGDDGKFYKFTNIANTDVAGAEAAYAGANLQIPGVDMTNMIDMPDEVTGLMGEAGYDGGMAFEDGQAAGLYDGQSEVLAACDNNSSAQIQAIKDTYGDMHKAGKGQAESQAGGIEDGYMDMYHAGNMTLDGFKLPWNTFSGASSVVTGSGANVGYNAVMSIYGGMEEAMNVLPEGMKSMFQQAFDETEASVKSPKQWNMHSPSKTTEQWGQMIIAGLSNGIYDATPEAVTSMTELSNSMMNSFTNPLDYVAKVASGELAYDPSIRPILDTSNISTGAYGIRSMFDNQNVTLSGFSGKLAADITELDTTNTQVVGELRALRNDMNVMTEQIAGMQIIMDSGQLVGAIAPGMDDALGRRAIHRGRGN